ncbi:MAG: dihydroorotate dehydrogenase [Polyangia bacterium]
MADDLMHTAMTKRDLVARSTAERLEVEVLGLRLTNPVLVASGPMSDSDAQIRRLLGAGAGAVVTKTLYSGKQPMLQERMIRHPCGALNSTTYSRRSLDRWLRWLSALAADGLPVVASIHADTPEALAMLAQAVSEAGCRALELGICCPNDGSQEQATASRIASYTASVRRAVSLPIAVKLTAMEGLLEGARAALNAGANAISLSDALPALAMDIETGHPMLCEPIGYSGPGIKPLVLYAIRCLRRAGVNCPILGIGGICTATDVVEYLQAGATVAQIYTALVYQGRGLLGSIIKELDLFCERHHTTVRQLTGKS